MSDDESIFAGDWRELPQSCDGQAEVWDQTIGCPKCGMNIWNLPKFGQWPTWDQNEPPADWWPGHRDGTYVDSNPYDPYVDLFERVHPNHEINENE